MLSLISFIAPGLLLAIVILAIATIVESKNTMKKGLTIRSLYFHVISLITLGIVVGSVIALFVIGFKTWVFPQAEPPLSWLGPPPSLYIVNPDAPDVVTDNMLTCQKDCSLTDSQKESLANWKDNYISWQTTGETPETRHTRDAVNALSFLIIALPIFIIHFRILQKDAKKTENIGQLIIRPTYFYFISVAALVMVVVSGGIMVNLVLKTWVFPSANKVSSQLKEIQSPAMINGNEKLSIQSVITCGDKCGLDEETKGLARQWTKDYEAWSEATANLNETQRDSANTLPFLLVGIPLFWYHFATVRNEAKEKKIKTISQ